MSIVLHIQIIAFIMLGVGLYKLRQDYFDKVVSICMVVSGVILFCTHLVLQVFV